MSRKRFDTLNCSIAGALDLVGDWWSLLIVREAFFGTHSFTGFVRNLGISRNILTDRLDRLTRADILEKHHPKADARRTHYRLTPKGKDLLPVLVSIMQWGDKWVNGPGAEPVLLTSRLSGEPIKPISIQTCSEHEISLNQLRISPGPGADTQTRKRYSRP